MATWPQSKLEQSKENLPRSRSPDLLYEWHGVSRVRRRQTRESESEKRFGGGRGGKAWPISYIDAATVRGVVAKHGRAGLPSPRKAEKTRRVTGNAEARVSWRRLVPRPTGNSLRVKMRDGARAKTDSNLRAERKSLVNARWCDCVVSVARDEIFVTAGSRRIAWSGPKPEGYGIKPIIITKRLGIS